MTVALRFVEEFARRRPGRDGAAELLPVTLAEACVAVLPIAAAGISVFAEDSFRVPVGASNRGAADAERLQFTVGQGPCLEAHATGQPVLADENVLAERWPEFYGQLRQKTPFRAIAAIPMRNELTGWGALDLYFQHSHDLAVIPLDEAQLIAELVGSLLIGTVPDQSPDAGPAWLDAPSAASRRPTMIAMGMLNVALEVTALEALDVLRAHAYSSDSTVDQVADDVIHRRLPLGQLRLDQNT